MSTRLSCVRLWVGLLLTLVASPVLAGSDTFHLGTGRDGVLVASQPGLQVNRYARLKAPLATGDVTVQVDSAEGFAAGDLVMVLQTTGLVPAAVPGSVAPMELGHDAVGRWELARLASVDGDVLSLTSSLLSSYAAEVSQVIRVPEFTSVHVQPGANLVAQPWDGATGGVLAFLATGTLLNEGFIDVSGMGFRGGSPTMEETGCSSPGSTGEGVDSTAHGRASGPENVANGGGGGTCRGRAGGGGGNASAGGQSGLLPWRAGGMGGAPLVYSLLDHLTLGGGGGGGYMSGARLENEAQGGRGGGAIFIRAGALDGNGTISASGEAGGFSVSEGPGGGGAGGSILVRLAGTMRCGGLHAEGGRGGASLGTAELVSGGGGGGGRVLYQAVSVTGCPTFSGAWLSDSWSDAPEASAEGSVTVLPGGFIRPEAATILWPGNGSTIDTPRPAIFGRATTGMEVVVYLDGAEAGRVVAEGGLFSFTPDQALSVGKHAVQVESSYQGVHGGRSSLHAFVIKRSAGSSIEGDRPELFASDKVSVSTIGGKPSSTDAGTPTYVATSRPIIIGDCASAKCNSTDKPVTVQIRKDSDDALVQELIVKPYSCPSVCNWSISPSGGLSEVKYKLVVTLVSGETSTYYFTVDETAPLTAPEISSGFPARISNNTNPTLKGKFAEVGKVLISIDGEPTGTRDVLTAGGEWVLGPTSVTSGEHSLQVVGQDRAGNLSPAAVMVFHVDTTPPAAPVVSFLGGKPVSDSSTVVKINTRTPVIKGSAEPYSPVLVTGGSASKTITANGSGIWEDSLPTLPTGTSPSSPATLTITARDSLGNGPSSPTGVSYFVDQADPGLNVLSVGNKTHAVGFPSSTTLDINLTQPAITGTLSEPGRVSVTLTRTDSASDTQTLEAVSPSGGSGAWSWGVAAKTVLQSAKTYTLSVNGFDEAGNSVSNSYTVNIDTTPPVTTSIRCPAQTGAPAPYQFEFGVSGDTLEDMSFQCSLDGLPVTCTNIYSLSSATETDHLLLASAVDKAGNVDATPVSCFWTVSNAAFTIFIREPPASLSNSPDASFRPETNRTSPSYQCQLRKDGSVVPGQDWAPCVLTAAGKIEYRGLTDGSYLLNLRAIAGSELATGSWPWLVDLKAPAATTITKPATDGLYLNTSVVALEGNGEPLGTDRSGEKFYVQIYVDSTPDNNPSPLEFLLSSDRKWSYNLPRLEDGDRYVNIYIRDEANNRSAVIRRDFTIDTSPPETSISSVLPARLTKEPSATFSFSSPTDASFIKYECNLDDLGFEECNGTDTVSHTVGVFTGDRTHTLQVCAKDRAGNYDPSPVQFAWRVDTVAPETFIESGPRPLTNEQSATFVLRTEAGASLQCSLDGAAFTPCPADAYTGLEHGPHVLQVQAQDEATNVDETPAEYRWVVDLLPPDAPGITWPEADTVLSKAFPEVRGTSEAGGRVDVFLGDTLVGSATANDEGSWKVSLDLAVSDGQYELVVWGRDVAGNRSTAPATRTVMVDATPPDTSILEGPTGRRRETHASFQFSSSESDSTFECSLDFGEFEPCGAAMEYEVPAGEHTLRVRALDRVKNPDPTPASRVWQVYRGGDSKAIGGGLSCSATPGGSPIWAMLWLLGLAALSARRTRR